MTILWLNKKFRMFSSCALVAGSNNTSFAIIKVVHNSKYSKCCMLVLLTNRYYYRLAYLRMFWSLMNYNINAIEYNNILIIFRNTRIEKKHNLSDLFLRFKVAYKIIISKCVTVGTLGFVFEKTFSRFRVGCISLESIMLCGVSVTLRISNVFVGSASIQSVDLIEELLNKEI